MKDCFAIVAMGVSGCGKSTFGRELARALDRPFIEGDEYHPAASVAKMRAGIALTDSDRWPWLRSLSRALGDLARSKGCAVASCSALRLSYRECLREHIGLPTVVLLLDVPRAMLEQRMASRDGHYMPVALLASQLETLEVPRAENFAFVLDGTLPIPVLVDQSLNLLRLLQATAPGGSAPAK